MQLRRTVAFFAGGVWGAEPNGVDDLAVARVADFDMPRLATKPAIPTSRAIEQGQRGARLLRQGDLLLEKSGGGDKQNVGRVVQWTGSEPAVCSNFVNVLRPVEWCDPRYLAYLHRSLYLTGWPKACTKQTTGIQNLDVEAYLRAPVPSFSLDVQRGIALFLDIEMERLATAEDSLSRLTVAAKDAYLALARELIVEPEFEHPMLKRVARTGTGHTPSRSNPEYWVPEECNLPWFGLSDVWQVRDDARDLVFEIAEKISDIGLRNSAAVKHPAGTVFMSRTASVGFVGQMQEDMAVTQDFMTWTCGPRILPEYLLHALRACRPEIMQLVQGSTHKTIYMPDLMNIRVPLPSLEEQRAIVRVLQPRLEARRMLSPGREALSVALAGYRDALVCEAVTGKFDLTSASDEEMTTRLQAAAEGGLDEAAA